MDALLPLLMIGLALLGTVAAIGGYESHNSLENATADAGNDDSAAGAAR